MKHFICRDRRLDDSAVHVMGILNMTPDSFSDGGDFFSKEAAVARAAQAAAEGADIIDIGAMSTRPGSSPVSPEEEMRRLGCLPDIVAAVPEETLISVDTVCPETAAFVLERGAHIINDVSGVLSEAMAAVVGSFGAGWIITHTACLPAGERGEYPDGAAADVSAFFDRALGFVSEQGIPRGCVALDPGFGFAKGFEDDIELLKSYARLFPCDVFSVAGTSRKRFIGAATGEKEPKQRLGGTVAANTAAMLAGANIIRVHDVKPNADAAKLINYIIDRRRM